jgi:glycosyltransferase involved in cell wall biosynthesis
MERPMRLAILCWDVAGPGGLNTFMHGIHKAAELDGDTCYRFHVSDWVAFDRRFYAGSKTKNMGHNHLTVEGDLSMAPAHIDSNARYLEKNFDVVILITLTPHPTKNQPDPIHIPFLAKINIPIYGCICDGLWPSYHDFAMATLAYTQLPLFSANRSYQTSIPPEVPSKNLPYFLLPDPEIHRTEGPTRLIWSSQWKPLKGIRLFLAALKSVRPDILIDLYGGGIDYFQTRSTHLFFDVVGENFVHTEYSGIGRAAYYGHVPLKAIPRALSKAHFMADWHGISPKFPAYTRGSYNNTLIEALYYGALPVLAEQMLNSDVPKEHFLTVSKSNCSRLGDLLADKTELARNPERAYAARQWVLRTHTAEIGYQQMREVLCSQATHRQ